MLNRCNSSRYIIRARQHFFVRQLGTKWNRGFSIRDSDKEDEDEGFGKEAEKQEGSRLHLFKSRGQHLLTNPRVLDAIIRKSGVNSEDTVLEIGPGTGNLTLKLLEAARSVVAVEIDKRMVEILHKRTAERGFGDRLSVIWGDALKAEFPRFDLVVANIPYGISSPLLAKLVFGGFEFRSGTLLLQKDFARRLLANPGDSEFNRLAANVKLVADVQFVMDVSKKDFLPIPKVDSSVVKIWPKEEIPSVDLNEWWAFTRTCFSKKNKTLGATFKQKRKLMELIKLSAMEGLEAINDVHCSNCETSGDEEEVGTSNECENDFSVGSGKGLISFREKVIGILRSSGFEGKRPSKLSNEELVYLLSLFNQAGIYFCN